MLILQNTESEGLEPSAFCYDKISIQRHWQDGFTSRGLKQDRIRKPEEELNCPNCVYENARSVTKSAKEKRIIEKSPVTPSLLAHIFVSKHMMHTPYYCLEDYLRCVFERAPYCETTADWEKLLLLNIEIKPFQPRGQWKMIKRKKHPVIGFFFFV